MTPEDLIDDFWAKDAAAVAPAHPGPEQRGGTRNPTKREGNAVSAGLGAAMGASLPTATLGSIGAGLGGGMRGGKWQGAAGGSLGHLAGRGIAQLAGAGRLSQYLGGVAGAGLGATGAHFLTPDDPPEPSMAQKGMKKAKEMAMHEPKNQPEFLKGKSLIKKSSAEDLVADFWEKEGEEKKASVLTPEILMDEHWTKRAEAEVYFVDYDEWFAEKTASGIVLDAAYAQVLYELEKEAALSMAAKGMKHLGKGMMQGGKALKAIEGAGTGAQLARSAGSGLRRAGAWTGRQGAQHAGQLSARLGQAAGSVRQRLGGQPAIQKATVAPATGANRGKSVLARLQRTAPSGPAPLNPRGQGGYVPGARPAAAPSRPTPPPVVQEALNRRRRAAAGLGAANPTKATGSGMVSGL